MTTNERTTDVLKPSPALLASLGSLVVHAEEYLEEMARGNADAAQFDADAMRGLLADPNVRAWLSGMKALCLLPEKR